LADTANKTRGNPVGSDKVNSYLIKSSFEVGDFALLIKEEDC